MSKYVVYVSKSGNIKAIAEKIAKVVGCELLPLNLMDKKGINSSETKAKEETIFMSALKKCKNAELVFVGTPVIAKQPHSKIAKFVNTVEAKHIAFFITYENNMGFTLRELKNSAEIRSIRVLGDIEYDNMESSAISDMTDSERQEILKKAERFAIDCIQAIK
jgi:menaquinone-dependent protoporphyrinogen IX oxidase